MSLISVIQTKKISPEQIFMISVLMVNGGNYLYNLILGRLLGPAQFADAAVLVTFLLVLSFAAMTFQLVTAKFSVIFEQEAFQSFVAKMYKNAVLVGFFFGILLVFFSKSLQEIFHTSSVSMFWIFGIGVPIYFVMSVNRGVYQGKKSFKSLSITYQTEMMSRLLFTAVLLYFIKIPSATIIAIGIVASFLFGLIPFRFKKIQLNSKVVLDTLKTKQVKSFFVITAFYEFTQIIINNSDLLLVKHYFDSYEAGLYASLALMGRIVYFITWMFVMLLLPAVVQLKKEGKETAPVLFKYVTYIALIVTVLVFLCILFPTKIVTLLFGENYISMASLLWKYAFATGLFALSNIFAYYYLSLDQYKPVFIAAFFGMLQVVLVVFYHNSLSQVVNMQIAAMFLLVLVQISYFIFDLKKTQNSLT